MLSDLTAEKIRLTMLHLWMQRQKGEIPVDREISAEHMARVSAQLGVPVSERTFRRVTSAYLHRARQAAQQIMDRESHPSPSTLNSQPSTSTNP